MEADDVCFCGALTYGAAASVAAMLLDCPILFAAPAIAVGMIGWMAAGYMTEYGGVVFEQNKRLRKQVAETESRLKGREILNARHVAQMRETFDQIKELADSHLPPEDEDEDKEEEDDDQ